MPIDDLVCLSLALFNSTMLDWGIRRGCLRGPARPIILSLCDLTGVLLVAGSIMFHIRKRPADMQPRKRKKKLYQSASSHAKEQPDDSAPFLLELRHGNTFFYYIFEL